MFLIIDDKPQESRNDMKINVKFKQKKKFSSKVIIHLTLNKTYVFKVSYSLKKLFSLNDFKMIRIFDNA